MRNLDIFFFQRRDFGVYGVEVFLLEFCSFNSFVFLFALFGDFCIFQFSKCWEFYWGFLGVIWDLLL